MKKHKSSLGETLSGLVLPAMVVLAWVFALSGQSAPGAVAGEIAAAGYLKWMLYFAAWVFLFSSIMHSVFASKMARSIGWKTNGFQYEIAFASLGLSLGSFYAVYHNLEAQVAISIPIIVFLVLAGINHVVDMVRQKNYAPNNTLILVWDFGLPLSLGILIMSLLK